jgi:hypothetical protein
VVAEIGAQCRDVSTVLCQALTEKRGGRAILVDVKRERPQNTVDISRTKAMRKPGNEKDFFPDVATFVEMDHLDQWRTVLSHHADHYDVLVLDLNTVVGNDLDLSALALVHEFAARFPTHRLVLIKSAALQNWATRLVAASALRHVRPRQSQQTKKDLTTTTLPNNPDPVIVGTVGVAEYRHTIPRVVHPGDTVLEVGCHLGTTTALLQKQATKEGRNATVWGVDVGPKIVARARRQYPDINFAVGNAWKTAQLQRLLWNQDIDTPRLTLLIRIETKPLMSCMLMWEVFRDRMAGSKPSFCYLPWDMRLNQGVSSSRVYASADCVHDYSLTGNFDNENSLLSRLVKYRLLLNSRRKQIKTLASAYTLWLPNLAYIRTPGTTTTYSAGISSFVTNSTRS